MANQRNETRERFPNEIHDYTKNSCDKGPEPYSNLYEHF